VRATGRRGWRPEIAQKTQSPRAKPRRVLRGVHDDPSGSCPSIPCISLLLRGADDAFSGLSCTLRRLGEGFQAPTGHEPAKPLRVPAEVVELPSLAAIGTWPASRSADGRRRDGSAR